MEFRFRYLGPQGEEIEVASLERLRALVQDGTVGELTLLFDALTREWAPARAHAVYRFLRDESRPRADGPLPPPPPPSLTDKRRTRSRGPELVQSDAAAPAKDSLGLDMAFSMAEPTVEPDAEETAREMMKARARDEDVPKRVDSFAGWTPTPSKPADAPRADAPGAAAPRADAPRAAAPPEEYGPFVFTAAEPAAPLAATLRATSVDLERVFEIRHPLYIAASRVSWPERVHGWLDRLGRLLIDSVGPRAVGRTLVIAGLIGLLVVLLATVRQNDDGTPVMTQAASLGPDVGRLVANLGPAQASGFQNMVTGVDSLRRAHAILQVPPIWLEGKYLADAPRYPEVKDFWLRYQAFLADVRANDTALYRTGFVRSMEDQGLGGTVLTLRLSQAMRDFEKSQPKREEVYRHMEELSSASLQLHALLVDRTGDITYEPAIQHGVSREPVVEAVAEDTLLRDHMWTLLERIFASLEWVGGDLGGSRDNLTESLLQGIQASAH